MSDEVATVQQLDEGAVRRALAAVDEKLPGALEALRGLGSSENLLAVLAWVLTCVLASHPELFDQFMQLLAAFEPRYEDLVGRFAVAEPEAFRKSVQSDTVLFLPPSLAVTLPKPSVN